MRRTIGWVLAVLTFFVVTFFTFPWFCSGEIIEFAPGLDGSNESWTACGTMGVLLERDISMWIQIPISLLLAFGAAYVVRRLVLMSQPRVGIDKN